MATETTLSCRQILVGRFPTGLSGLDEIFVSLYEAGRRPTDELGAELVYHTRQHNYIPPSAEGDFAAALLNEYRTYYESRQSGQQGPPKRATWRGLPRELVPWFPVLDESLCDGCDKCLQFCASQVYAKRDSGTVYVDQPMNCVVGCDACARLCRYRAITFPPRAILASVKAWRSAR